MNEVIQTIPKGEDDEEEDDEQVTYIKKKAELNKKRSNKKPEFKSKDWIVKLKERQRRQGRDVRSDTKYTGRRRPGKGF